MLADRRADIWAFGCVLYEMLTGYRAFDGEEVTDTLAAVLRDEVDWTKYHHAAAPDSRKFSSDAFKRTQEGGSGTSAISELSWTRSWTTRPGPRFRISQSLPVDHPRFSCTDWLRRRVRYAIAGAWYLGAARRVHYPFPSRFAREPELDIERRGWRFNFSRWTLRRIYRDERKASGSCSCGL